MQATNKPLFFSDDRKQVKLLLLVLAILSGFAASALGLPAAFLTGPLLIAACFAVTGWSVVRFPLFFRRFAQSAIGMTLSFSITGKSLQIVAVNWLPVAMLVLVMFVLTTIIGVLLHRFANLQAAAALLGTLPGGSGEMVAMSDSIGADVRLVTVMQYGRLLAILATISIVGHLVGVSGGTASALHYRALSATSYSTAAPNYLVSIIIALIGAGLGTRFRIPAGTIVIPAVLATMAGFFGIAAAPWPPFVLAGAYLVLGLQIGGNFDTAVMRQLKRLGWAVLLSNAFLLATSALLALFLSPLLKIDFMSAYLAATPGGLDSVAAMATNLKADAALILAVHSLRLISVLLIGPYLVQIVGRRLARTTNFDLRDPKFELKSCRPQLQNVGGSA
jgi:membrane AbrB-like protein